MGKLTGRIYISILMKSDNENIPDILTGKVLTEGRGDENFE
jgi:hypothetical protein